MLPSYAQIASDNFNIADVNPIGGPWTTITSTSAFKIASNVAAATTGSADCGVRWTGPAFPADQWVQARFTMAGTNTGTGPGLVARCASGAQTLYILVANHNSTGSCTLYKGVAGTFTNPWSPSARSVAWSDGDTFRLEVRGTTIRAFKNGVQIGADATDSGIASGNPGMYSSSTVTSASLEDWQAGTFTDCIVINSRAINRASSF